MRRLRNFTVKRAVARVLVVLGLLLWNAPPAAAFQKPRVRKPARTQTPDAELQAKIDAKEREARKQPDVRELTPAEMRGSFGRGPYRNRAFCGVLPWQRSLRDVNLCNGNLFKSFTDIQVAPARGAGLAFQRSYNSNDDRVGPFGVGWTHPYEIRMEEAGDNQVPRTDFFGGQHTYTRDADGLYTSPSYCHDQLSSTYDNTAVDEPPVVLSDTQTAQDGTVKHFFANGTSGERDCDTITDRHGNVTTLTYGQSAGDRNLLTQVTDPSGRSLQITWSNLGTTMSPAWRITQVQGPFDPVTEDPVYTVTYEYNSSFNLWKVHQDPSGLNRITTYTYTTVSGEAGLLASISDPLSHTVSYTYSLTNNSNDPNPTDTLWVTSVTEPGSGGNLVWDIDAYWGGGMWNNSPLEARCTSNDGLEFICYSDTSLRKKMYGLLSSQATWETLYDTANNVTYQREGTLQCGGWYNWTIDVYPWNTTTNGGPSHVTTYTYGPRGNVLTATTSGFSGETTTTTYYGADKYFQKATVTDALSHTTTFDYYPNTDTNAGNRGEVAWVRDARYGTTGEQFEYTYNSYGQKTSETNLNNVVTNYTYGDTWGNLTQVVQDPGMGHLARTTTMTYDVAGRVTGSTDPLNQSSSFTFNAVGQPLVATLPDDTVTYTYGSNGRTATVTDDRGTTTISYESGNDRVASVQDPVTGTISYTYGLGGQRASVSLPGSGTWSYTYASSNRVQPKDDPESLGHALQRLTDDQNRKVDYRQSIQGTLHDVFFNQTYDGSGNLTSYCHTWYGIDVDNATYPAYTHLRTATVRNSFVGTGGETVLVQNDYTYDAVGNRLTNTISDNTGPLRTEEYGYDALNRLTSVDYDDGETQGYTFDPMGNRTYKSDNVTGNESYTYNAANMLTARGGSSYTNDANGNQLTGGGRDNTWDGENRLIECEFTVGMTVTTTTHTYGADGFRHRTVQGMDTTDFVLDGQSVVRTFLNSSVDKTFLHGLRGPEYERTGSSSPLWYLYDGLGSVLGTVDSAGNVVHARKYDVYGIVRDLSGPMSDPSGPKHKFVGGLGHPSEDETGLIYMRARYYDPVTGRFSSEDPARHGNNWFSYANACPTRYADATGKVPVEDLILALDQGVTSIFLLIIDQAPLAAGEVQGAASQFYAFLNLFEDKIGAMDLGDALEWARSERNFLEAMGKIRKSIALGEACEQLDAETSYAADLMVGLI